MDSFTVAQLGRSTSRVMTAAERGPVAITRQDRNTREDKPVAVVVSPRLWQLAFTALRTSRGALLSEEGALKMASEPARPPASTEPRCDDPTEDPLRTEILSLYYAAGSSIREIAKSTGAGLSRVAEVIRGTTKESWEASRPGWPEPTS